MLRFSIFFFFGLVFNFGLNAQLIHPLPNFTITPQKDSGLTKYEFENQFYGVKYTFLLDEKLGYDSLVQTLNISCTNTYLTYQIINSKAHNYLYDTLGFFPKDITPTTNLKSITFSRSLYCSPSYFFPPFESTFRVKQRLKFNREIDLPKPSPFKNSSLAIHYPIGQAWLSNIGIRKLPKQLINVRLFLIHPQGFDIVTFTSSIDSEASLIKEIQQFVKHFTVEYTYD